MRGPGILWMLQTAAGFSMAGPMFVVGLEFLRTGRTVAGIGFLALGAVALYFPTYLVNRIGGPRTWIRRRIRRARAGGSDPGADGEPEGGGPDARDVSDESDAASDDPNGTPFERLRRR